jgi:hypothetical protein
LGGGGGGGSKPGVELMLPLWNGPAAGMCVLVSRLDH